MPTLDWIGKKAVVNHHREVPYRLVHCDGELSSGDADAGNLLVQGDNLEALKALLPYYAGKVKCIYIDPPYNTGNEGWVYNDNVNSPEIKKWLGNVVGKEAEDLSRHDKWLCMMYPRLRLLREFLREDGVIFVSIDDAEAHNLILMMNELYGARNHLANIVWEKADSPKMDALTFSTKHEFIVCYSKNHLDTEIKRKILEGDEIPPHYNRQDKNGRLYYTKPLRAMGGQGDSRATRPNLYYALKAPDNSDVYPVKADGTDGAWRWSSKKVETDKDRIEWIGNSEQGWSPYYRIFADTSSGRPAETLLRHETAGSNRTSKVEINSILHDRLFDTPKPTKLLKQILPMVCDNGDLILDSFAGSGTTGHAVLDLNKQDDGNRKFILVEMDEQIASDITAERLKRVINGYDKGGDPDKPVDGLGGGFRYCRLGVPLFNEFGDIDGGVTFPDLAAHVFFAECGAPIPAKATGNSPYLGQHQDKAVYLLFSSAEAGFAREASGNVLTPDVLAALPTPPDGFEGGLIVYGEGCTVGKERLAEAGVTFKQIPYQIEGA